MVLGGRGRRGRVRARQVRGDAGGRGHRTISGRFDGPERPAVCANVAVAGVVRVERVHDENIYQRVSL